MRRPILPSFLALLFTAVPLFAQKTIGDGIEDLAQQIAARTKSANKTHIAVFPLEDLHHAKNDIGAYVGDELSTSLAIQQVDVVERAKLDGVMTELKLQQTGAIDPETAKKVGKLAGADAIVTGTITELETTLTVSCHVVAVETGAVITAARTKITIDSDVAKLLGRPTLVPLVIPPAQSATVRYETSKPKPERTAATKETKPSAIFQDIRVTVDKAERKGDTITLTIAFELITSSGWNGQFNEPYLLDENGDRWEGRFEDGTHYSYINLLPGTRVRRKALFLAPQNGAAGTSFTLVSQSWRLTVRDIRPN